MTQKRKVLVATLKYYAVYVAVLLASISALVAAFFIEQFAPHSLGGYLIKEMGIAGIIACVLAVTIERISAREFRRQAEKERIAIKQDVLFNVLGHHLPDRIKNEITTQILTEAFIRKNMKMAYVLKPLTDVDTDRQYVLVDFTLTYDIVNLTTETKDFILKSAFRKSPIESLSEQARFISIEVVGSERPVTLAGKDIPFKEDHDFISLDYMKPVLVKPGPEHPTTIKVHSQSVKHYAGGLSYFTLDYHTCELELSVHVPENGLAVYSGVSPGTGWLSTTFRHNPDNGYHNWNLQRPLLAFQGIYVGWDPKKPAAIPPSVLPHEEPLGHRLM